MLKFQITYQEFKKYYIEEELSIDYISKIIGCSRCHVYKIAKKFNLKRQPVRKRENLTEKVYGDWKLLKFVKRTKTQHPSGENRNYYWLAQCIICGIEKVASLSYFKRIYKCASCYTKSITKNYKELSWSYFGSIKNRATYKNIEFDLNIKYIYDLYVKQEGKCNLSGVPITLVLGAKKMKLMTASLDRIDSSKGYVKGNVQWVHKIVNFMKQTLNDNEFIKWCNLVVKHKGK